jgi:geranylgeranyl pyrophosphate synthase
MDDDTLRRGRPSCHVQFGQAQAVLAGDALLTKAFVLLAGGPAELAVEWIGVLARAAGDAGWVGGRALDMTLERGAAAAEISAMHARKTAALIEGAAELGAVSARAEAGVRDAVRRYGRALGLLFQATDDLLDVTGDAATLGKRPGTDDRNERPTLVATLGVDGARRAADSLAETAHAAATELTWTRESRPALLVDHVLGRSA